MAEISEPIGVPEIFFDGVIEIKMIEGVARFGLFARRDGKAEVVARLAIPISELPDVIQSLVIALAEAVKNVVKPVLSS